MKSGLTRAQIRALINEGTIRDSGDIAAALKVSSAILFRKCCKQNWMIPLATRKANVRPNRLETVTKVIVRNPEKSVR